MTPFPFRYQKLTEAQAGAIQGALADGVSAQDLAGEYGVSVRTIYRARNRSTEPVVTVTAGDWAGRFAITDEGPVQVEPWRPTPEALV